MFNVVSTDTFNHNFNDDTSVVLLFNVIKPLTFNIDTNITL